MATKTEHQIALGRRVRELRQWRGLSQLDMVRLFEMSLSHYQKIERGVLDPRFTTLKKLSVCFGVSLSELVRGL